MGVCAGGVPCTGFVDLYGLFTRASEANKIVEDTDHKLPGYHLLDPVDRVD